MRKQVCLAAALLAVFVGVPSVAAAQHPPDEPAAAREFAYAAYRLRVAIKAHLPEIQQAAALTRSPACRAALRGATPRQEREHLDDLVGVLVDLLAGAMFAPVAAPLQTFQAELDRIATADPGLRGGRAAWRSSVALYLQVRPLPADLCARLGRWRSAGYAAASRPDLQPAAVRRILDGSGAVDAKLHVAAARMVELGIPAHQARRFAGDTLFNGFSAEDLLGLTG
ncbi:MAG: hypothetical protein QOG77_367 [Solirubrobacteraceae bacterium]|nr:hypothetical protein [Solirubrobacteraceae bacterium]